MSTQEFIKRTRIAAPAEEVFHWHEDPHALEYLTPPWERVEIIERTGGIRQIGSRVVLRIYAGPFQQIWISEHTDYEPGWMFRDRQVKGPFALWVHTHRVEPDGPEVCFLEDRIEYRLPFGLIGRLFAGAFVWRKLERLFDYRHRVTAESVLAEQGAMNPADHGERK